MEEHVLENTILIGGHFLLEGMSYGRMSYWRTYLSGRYALCEDMSYQRTCIAGDIS